jgi:hypothetical protein
MDLCHLRTIIKSGGATLGSGSVAVVVVGSAITVCMVVGSVEVSWAVVGWAGVSIGVVAVALELPSTVVLAVPAEALVLVGRASTTARPMLNTTSSTDLPSSQAVTMAIRMESVASKVELTKS